MSVGVVPCRLVPVLVTALALVALAFAAACADDPEPEPAPAAAQPPPADTPTPAPSEPPQPTEAPAQTPTAETGGGDAPYLRVLCTAGDALQDAILAAAVRLETGSADPDAPEAFAELFVEPLGAFLEAMRGVTPPADLAEYHAATLAGYEGFIELLASLEESGGPDDAMALLGGMLGGAADAPAVSPETLARLARAAADIPECAGSIVLASFLGQDAAPPADTGTAAGADPEAEAYVRELCLAGDAFDAASGAALAGLDAGTDPVGGDPAVFAAVFHEPLRALAADLALITPPDEVAAYHAAASGRYEEMVSVLDAITGALDAGADPAAGDLDRFQELLRGGGVMPGLPSADANRLGQAANHVPECFGSGFLLGFLGGGP
ncbi:MAG: hypothetical protein OXG38_01920 [Chloroflexi bacterium]|nr:hypothetical protein [Chloroflexota bacterium]